MSSSFDRSVLDRLREALRDEQGVFAARLIDAFVGQSDELVAELERTCREADLPAVQLAAHKLRGSAGSVGGALVVDRCDEIEHWQGSQRDVAPLVETVRDEMLLLTKELAGYRQEAVGTG